jgi:hypothetical protein
MTEFNEMHHAFIAARFYKRLLDYDKDKGLQTFIHATHQYAQQRGFRMAQRAIRDGKPLTFATYKEYGEWEGTQTALARMGGFDSSVVSLSPDHEEHIRRCPWAYQFKAMDMQECGAVYCSHLDKAIARGFNPYLVFDVPQSVNTHDCCIQIMRDAFFEDGQAFEKKTENMKGFDYHCGHLYKTFGDIARAIFKEGGEEIAGGVLQDFGEAYGSKMAAVLPGFGSTDFNIIS